jgi:hypothetical protein
MKYAYMVNNIFCLLYIFNIIYFYLSKLLYVLKCFVNLKYKLILLNEINV